MRRLCPVEDEGVKWERSPGDEDDGAMAVNGAPLAYSIDHNGSTRVENALVFNMQATLGPATGPVNAGDRGKDGRKWGTLY